MTAVQVAGRVLRLRRVGAYWAMTVLAPGVAEPFKSGHFVALSVGGPDSSMLLRRSFAVMAAETRGAYGATVEVVFAVHGRGTAWLASRREGDPLDVVGPLGRPFPLPRQKVHATLVGGGYGSAPLLALADALLARGSRVDFVLGASTENRLFGALEAKRRGASIAVTTEDGSVGTAGRVSDVLPGVIERTTADIVYACGPMGMLHAVAEIASAAGIPSQVAVEESMACGIGVCMTCVLPVVGEDGNTRMVRSCVEGPVFAGESVRFDAVGTVPPDAIGAPGSPSAGEAPEQSVESTGGGL